MNDTISGLVDAEHKRVVAELEETRFRLELLKDQLLAGQQRIDWFEARRQDLEAFHDFLIANPTPLGTDYRQLPPTQPDN